MLWLDLFQDCRSGLTRAKAPGVHSSAVLLADIEGSRTCFCPAKHSLLHQQSCMTAVLLPSDMVEHCSRLF